MLIDSVDLELSCLELLLVSWRLQEVYIDVVCSMSPNYGYKLVEIGLTLEMLDMLETPTFLLHYRRVSNSCSTSYSKFLKMDKR